MMTEYPPPLPSWDPGSLSRIVAEQEADRRRDEALRKVFEENDGELRVNLQWLRLGASFMLPEYIVDSLTLQVVPETGNDETAWFLRGQLLSLRAYLLAEELPKVKVVEESTVVHLQARAVIERQVPRTWWDHWKYDHQRAWWAGWLVRWRGFNLRPIRAEKVERDARKVTLRVDLAGKVTYPEAKVDSSDGTIRYPEARIPIRPSEYGKPITRVHIDHSMSVEPWRS
jgi:hypothetical protein